ncbi:AMP-binding enzyme [Microthyrium microscopicum]|uniref:AMP-binding enzyme n=1 Tax=Microthyrium microscopicum TaxID=703497 RepID=A0A6A6U4T7_9PEZI|nr:AMP-binding enzyme [Microthyrium microscopicum]
MHLPDRYTDLSYLDLLSYTFENLSSYDQNQSIYVDAHDETNHLSAFQIKKYVGRLISGFRAYGLKPGDCVFVHSFNNIWYTTLYLAIIGAGGCCASANPSYKTLEIIDLFTLAEAKFVVVEPELLPNILPAIKQYGLPLANVFTFDMKTKTDSSGLTALGSFLTYAESDWVQFNDAKQAKETVAALLFTSGTTGLPKAAAMSHFSLVSMNVAIRDPEPKPYEVNRLLCLPQFHSFNASLTHVAPLRDGHPIHIMRRFNLEHYIEYAQQHRITETTMVPPIVMQIQAFCLKERVSLSTLQLILCAGSPLEKELSKSMLKLLSPTARMYQVYGMSETGWITSLFYPQVDESGSVGRLLPNVECKIVDENGAKVLEGCHGELLVHGPALMTGYLGNPEATKQAFVGSWLKTGDVGYMQQGMIYIVDRVKDMIKVRGWQVAPSELEAHLRTHPAVADVGVVGISLPDSLGELPAAYVVLKEPQIDRPVTADELIEYLGNRLSKIKALSGGIRFVDSIPRNVSGKILRKELRQRAQQDFNISKTVD